MQRNTSLMVGDVRLDRVADLDRFDMTLNGLIPEAEPGPLEPHRHWLEPQFMQGDIVGLAMHSVVLRVDGRVVLIDTCVGEHKARPRHPHWNDRSATAYLANLAAIGLAAEDVDTVFCTHLHADHVGWNTMQRDGRWVPTFPNARYLMGKIELAHWQAQLRMAPETMVNHGSYLDSVLPVIEAGRVDLVAQDHEVLDGLVVRSLFGHTPGQIGLTLHRQDQHCLFVGDAIHHPVQLVRPDWSSQFCSDPVLSRQTRQGFLAEAAQLGAWLVPIHFMGVTGMRIRHAGDGYVPLDV